MTENIVFTARLNESDWDSDKKAWRCPALDILGSVVQEVFVSGRRIDRAWYEILAGPAMIRWIRPSPPPQIAAVISLKETLSLRSDTEKWKKFTVKCRSLLV
jgi:hypothetical protein